MTSVLSSPDFDPNFAPYDPHAFDEIPLQPWPAQWHATKKFPTPQSVGDNPIQQELSSLISFDPSPGLFRLGDPNLPIAPYRDHFLDTVADNQRIAVSAETGSGKSTQLGLYLVEAGYPIVYITQPRNIAARNLYEWTKENLPDEHKGIVGYTTGLTEDSDCPPGARIIYIGDRVLFKLANRGKLPANAVVIHDEVHEENEAMLSSMAKMDDILAANSEMREISSSATMDIDSLAEYLGESGPPVPVLELPGRTHPVGWLQTPASVAEAMSEFMKLGLNVMAIEPGVGRLKSTASKAKILAGRDSKHVVHHLYGDQSPAQQTAALNPADGHHVVASKVGVTSITPVNKQVMVDSTLANVGGKRGPVRYISTEPASQSEMRQRIGRVGRHMEGVYVEAQPDDAPPLPPFSERPLFDKPIIEGVSVAPYILESLLGGERYEDLRLRKRPTEENLRYDYLMLERLGAIAVDGNEVTLTEIGRAMTDLPLDPTYARMLIEAGEPVEDPAIDVTALRLQVAAAAAIQQAQGILDIRQGSHMRFLRRKGHQEVYSQEQTSDVLFALDVFISMLMKQEELLASGEPDAATQFDQFLLSNDILPNRYDRALRTYREICLRLELEPLELTKPDEAHRERIVACQISGAEEIFIKHGKYTHLDPRGEHRTLGRRSTIAGHASRIVLGLAFDMYGLSARGRFRRKYISGATGVTAEQLLAYAPHRITRQSLRFAVNDQGKMVEREALYFDGEQLFAERGVDLSPTKATRAALITAMMTGLAPSTGKNEEMVPYRPGTPRAKQAAQKWREAQKLEHKSAAALNVVAGYRRLIARVVALSIEQIPLTVTDPAALDEVIPKIYLSKLVQPKLRSQIPTILEQSPDVIEITGEDGTKYDLPTTYKNNTAYVTIPLDARALVTRERIAALSANHPVKIRIAQGKYLSVDETFAILDAFRARETAKHERRQEQRLAAARLDPLQPTRRELREEIEHQVDASLKAQTKSMLSKRPNKGEPTALQRRRVEKRVARIKRTKTPIKLASVALA